MIYCFDVVGLAFLGQDMSKYHAYIQIYLFLCLLPCLWLDPHVSMLVPMFRARSMLLCALCHVYVQIYAFMCSLSCLCLDLCFYVPFSCLCLDLCFYVLFVMPMLRSMLLCALCHAYAWIYVFLGPVSCLCLDLHIWLLCHVLLQPFCP